MRGCSDPGGGYYVTVGTRTLNCVFIQAQQFPFMVAIIYFFWTFVALAIFRLDTLPEKIEDTDDLEEKAYTKVDLGEAGIEIVSNTVKEDNHFDKER